VKLSILVVALMAVGCDGPSPSGGIMEVKEAPPGYVKVQVQGHDYFKYESVYKMDTIHAPDCARCRFERERKEGE